MAQADGIVSNGSGAAVRADINNQLAAVFTNHSGTTEPTTTYAYQFWADTTNNLLKIRNSTNTGWVTLRQLDGEFDTLPVENGTNSAPSIYFKDSGTDSGFYSPGTDQVAVSTVGVQRVNFNAATEVVFNDTGADVDFRIEGDTEENLFVIDAGTDQVRVKNLNGGSLAGARNRIINGDMRIDQRNAGASVTSSDSYVMDRWKIFENTDGVFSCQKVSDAPAGFVNSAKITITTADSSLAASQRGLFFQQIEGFNTDDLAFGTASAKTITLSFWVKSSVTGSYGGSLVNGNATRSYPFSYTVSSANTWEQKSIPIPGDTTGTWATDNTASFQVILCLGTGTDFAGAANTWASSNFSAPTSSVNLFATLNATWQITGVQLEPGTVATPFERRSYGQELALCQRYAYAWGTVGVQVAAAGGNAMYSDANQIAMVPFGLNTSAMRDVPTTITAVGTQGTDWAVQSSGGANQTGFTLITSAGAITVTKTSHGLGSSAILRTLTSSGRIIVSSEL